MSHASPDGVSTLRFAVALLVLALALPTSAQQMSSDRFILRGGSLNGGGGADLESVIGDQAGLTIGQPAVGISQNGSGNRFLTGGFWAPGGGAIEISTCAGDCNLDRRVAINELITGVNIAVGRNPLERCSSFDSNRDGRVAINELIAAVRNALSGCERGATLRGASSADASGPIRVQGKVVDVEDSPRAAPGTIDVGVWTQAVEGTRLYSERHDSIFVNGVFHLSLGSGTQATGNFDAETFAGEERWLEVTIDGEVLSPRQRIGASAYALQAEQAQRAAVAESVEGVAEGSEVVSTDGGTFTGPVTLAGPSGAANVSLGSVPGQPELGMVAVNDADGDQAVRMSVDTGGRGRISVEADGSRLVEIGGAVASGEDPLDDESPAATSGLDVFGGSIFLDGPNGDINILLGSLRSNPDHGFVSVNNATGDTRAALFVDRLANGNLILSDPTGAPRINATGQGRLFTFGPDGKLNTSLSIAPGNPNYGSVSAAGAEGIARARMLVDPNVGGTLDLFDTSGTARALMHADGRVETYGSNGNRNTLLVTPLGQPNHGLVAAAQEDGELRAELGVGAGGYGVVRTRGSNGVTSAVLGSSEQSTNGGMLSLWDFAGVRRLFTGPRPGTIRYHLELTDTGGVTRSSMNSDGLIEVRGPNGNRNAALRPASNSEDNGLFSVANADGTEVAGAFVNASGSGVVEVDRPDGSASALLQTLSSGAGFIETRGPNGNDNVSITASTTGADRGFLEVKNEQGTTAAQLFAGSDGTGSLIVRDAGGNRRAQLGSASETGLLEIRGPNGNRNATLAARGSNVDRGAVSLYDPNDDARALLFMLLGTDDGYLFVHGPNGNLNVITEPTRLAALDASGGARASLSIVGGFASASADIKNFVVPHPAKPGARIVYTSVEGPEAAMYHRGRVGLVDGRTTIELPEHFLALADLDTITVQLTPASAQSRGVGFDIEDEGEIVVAELQDGRGSYSVDFVVHAVRHGYQDYQPVVAAGEDHLPARSGSAATVENDLEAPASEFPGEDR